MMLLGGGKSESEGEEVEGLFINGRGVKVNLE